MLSCINRFLTCASSLHTISSLCVPLLRGSFISSGHDTKSQQYRMVPEFQNSHDCIANLLAAGMQCDDDILDYEEALDNLHLDIVLQLLQAGGDVKAVTAQVRPAALLFICALLPSSCKLSKTWSFCGTCSCCICMSDVCTERLALRTVLHHVVSVSAIDAPYHGNPNRS